MIPTTPTGWWCSQVTVRPGRAPCRRFGGAGCPARCAALPRERAPGRPPRPPLRRQVLLRVVRVVPSNDRRVGDLLERVLARLAGLDLDQVEDLVLPLDD